MAIHTDAFIHGPDRSRRAVGSTSESSSPLPTRLTRSCLNFCLSAAWAIGAIFQQWCAWLIG